jgi:hypothetical protein
MTTDTDEIVAPPGYLERAAVHRYFPQFRNAATLAHLARTGRGPLYVIVGGRAWYDPADIRAWLEENKQSGPGRTSVTRGTVNRGDISKAKKRGRPTKLEQMRRRSANVAVSGDSID